MGPASDQRSESPGTRTGKRGIIVAAISVVVVLGLATVVLILVHTPNRPPPTPVLYTREYSNKPILMTDLSGAQLCTAPGVASPGNSAMFAVHGLTQEPPAAGPPDLLLDPCETSTDTQTISWNARTIVLAAANNSPGAADCAKLTAQHPLTGRIHVNRLKVGDEFCLAKPSEHIVARIVATQVAASDTIDTSYATNGDDVDWSVTSWLASSG